MINDRLPGRIISLKISLRLYKEDKCKKKVVRRGRRRQLVISCVLKNFLLIKASLFSPRRFSLFIVSIMQQAKKGLLYFTKKSILLGKKYKNEVNRCK
jgi:hypothetical protein